MLQRTLYTLPYLFILYVLSVGPLYWPIYAAYFLDGSVFLKWFYFPLVLACEIDYVANFFDWYLQFWV